MSKKKRNNIQTNKTDETIQSVNVPLEQDNLQENMSENVQVVIDEDIDSTIQKEIFTSVPESQIQQDPQEDLEQVENVEIEENIVNSDNEEIEDIANVAQEGDIKVDTNNDVELQSENVEEQQVAQQENQQLDDDLSKLEVAPPTIGKKKMSPEKKKKITFWSIIAGVLIVAITLSITLPLVYFYKDKIFVSTAQEIVDADNLEKSPNKRIVLNKNITVDGDLILSKRDLDLNGHTLTVNGNLEYRYIELAKTINIGSYKDGHFVSNGFISAKNMIINAPISTLNLEAPVEVETLDII